VQADDPSGARTGVTCVIAGFPAGLMSRFDDSLSTL
jgi:hypothetical protein